MDCLSTLCSFVFFAVLVFAIIATCHFSSYLGGAFCADVGEQKKVDMASVVGLFVCPIRLDITGYSPVWVDCVGTSTMKCAAEIYMRSNIDNILGALAWCCGALVFWNVFFFDVFALAFDYIFVEVPIIWICLVIGVVVFRKRKMWDLGWVFISGLFVFIPWYWFLFLVLRKVF